LTKLQDLLRLEEGKSKAAQAELGVCQKYAEDLRAQLEQARKEQAATQQEVQRER